MNVCKLFDQSLARHADRTALIERIGKRRREVTFATLNAMVNSAAIDFQAAGLRAGDRVLLALPMSVETYAIMLALLRHGMVIMVIDPAHGRASVARILADWPPAAVVATRNTLVLRFLVRGLRRIPRRFVVGKAASGAWQLNFDSADKVLPDAAKCSPAHPALLTFTSGSTGEPKPVVRTHGFLRHQLAALQPVMESRPGDIDLVAMPMFVLPNLVNGVTSILPACSMKHPGRANPRVIAGQLTSERATRMVASPALLERLSEWCSEKAVLAHTAAYRVDRWRPDKSRAATAAQKHRAECNRAHGLRQHRG